MVNEKNTAVDIFIIHFLRREKVECLHGNRIFYRKLSCCVGMCYVYLNVISIP